MNDIIKKHYEENYDILVKRMGKRLDCVEDGEDVVQEAFTRALQYYKTWTGDRFENWFNVILSNVYKRFVTERRMGGLSKPLDDSLDELEPIIIDHFKALSKAEIKKFIGTKQGEDKDILTLNLIFGYSVSEISQLLGIKTKRATNILYQTTLEIKERYRNEGSSI